MRGKGSSLVGSLRCLRHRGQPRPGPLTLGLTAASFRTAPAPCSHSADRGPLPAPHSRAAWPDVTERDPGWGLGANIGAPGHTWPLPGPTSPGCHLPRPGHPGAGAGPGLPAAARGWLRGKARDSSSRLPELGGLAGLLAPGIREAVTGSGGGSGGRWGGGLRSGCGLAEFSTRQLSRRWEGAGLVSRCTGSGGPGVGHNEEKA